MSEAVIRDTMSVRTIAAGQAALDGRVHGLRAALPFAGPAVIASIAYMDPGNFATNIQAGARYGFSLLWVVVAANVIAMLFQALSAKLGIVTGKSLAAQCRDRLPRPLVWAMWIVSEIAAMATDLAEFLGGAIGLSLLFGFSLMTGLVITGIATYAILTLGNRGFRPIELVIGVFVVVIGLCYAIELLIAPPSWGGVLHGAITPHLADAGAVTLAVGIIGATVMPHAIYLHSALTQGRMPTPDDAARRKVLRWSNREVLVALGLAGLVNMAMITMAATTFHPGHAEVAEIETAYHTLTPLLGAAAAAVFMASLLASGLSSSVVGTMAGQSIMQDFLHVRTPLWLRRGLTMIPAFIVVGLGYNATDSLVASQVALSLALPVPMIALVYFTSRRDVMGVFVNARHTAALAATGAVIVLALNVLLLLLATGVALPGLAAG